MQSALFRICVSCYMPFIPSSTSDVVDGTCQLTSVLSPRAVLDS